MLVAVLVPALVLELVLGLELVVGAQGKPASEPSTLQSLAEIQYKEPRVHATKGCPTEVNLATDA